VKEDVMISWNDCDVRVAGHNERIARAERAGHLASSSVNRRRGMAATAAAPLFWVSTRAGAALIVVGHWLGGNRRVAEVG
jgi:hypothetical protein